MKTKKPTLEAILQSILTSLKNHQLPTEKDSLKFFTLCKIWQEQVPNSAARRRTFKSLSDAFKRRCLDANVIKRQNELWAALHAVNKAWLENKSFIEVSKEAKRTKKTKTIRFSSLTFTIPNGYQENLTFFNH